MPRQIIPDLPLVRVIPAYHLAFSKDMSDYIREQGFKFAEVTVDGGKIKVKFQRDDELTLDSRKIVFSQKVGGRIVVFLDSFISKCEKEPEIEIEIKNEAETR